MIVIPHIGARLFRRVAVLSLALSAALAPPALAHDGTHREIQATTRALARDPGDIESTLRRAELRRLAGDWNGAVADLAAARRLAPDRPEIDLCAAALAFDRKAADEALPSVDRYLTLRPVEPEALRLRARVLLALGRPGDAAADLSRALELDRRATPDHYLERAAAERAAGVPAERVLAGLEGGVARLGPVAGLVRRTIDLQVELGRHDAALARLDGLQSPARREKGSERPVFLPDAAGLGAESRAAGAAAAGIPQLPSPAASVTLLPRFSTWKYRDTPAALPSEWTQPGYDDSSWPTGPAPLGYGDRFIATVVPYGGNPTSKYVTTYFRTTFDAQVDLDSLASLTLAASYDDGFVLYLNGVEIARRSLPAGPIGYSTLAANHEGGTYETVDVTASLGVMVTGSNQLALELHQQAPNSSDLAIDLELVASTGASVTRGPYLQRGSSSGVVVRWRTDTPTTSQVCHSGGPEGPACVTDNTSATEHEIALTGLTPATRYDYSVGTANEVLAGEDGEHWFVTAPATGTPGPTRLWILGDSGTANVNAAAVRDAFLDYTGARGADLWLMLGDNAYPLGTDAEYQAAVFDMYPGPLRQWVLWPTRGNHELLYAGPGNDYYDLFTLPTAGECGGTPSGTEAYYSFDYANLHVVCLDSEGSNRTPGGAMAQWLVADLAATTQEWIIAFWHHPPYTKGSHDSDNDLDSGGRMRDMRQNLLPLLEAGGVDLMLTGHSHSYERSFLIDGHHGPSWTLAEAMKVDSGDGQIEGDGPYVKPSGTAPNQGAVHAVAGSSGQTSGGLLDHPVMVASLNELGSMVLDVQGGRLDGRFLSHTGVVRDSFTILKTGTLAAPPSAATPSPLDLLPIHPNPTRETTRLAFTLPAAGPARLAVLDPLGRQVRVLADGVRPAGHHELTWDGHDGAGRRVGPGVFFVTLETRDGVWSRKLVRVE